MTYNPQNNSKNSLGPSNIKHLQVVFHNANLLLLMCLVKVLQNNSNVHVNHNHKVDDDERHKEDNGDHRVATVAIWLVHVSDVTVRRLGHERVQDIIPASRSDQSGRRKRF